MHASLENKLVAVDMGIMCHWPHCKYKLLWTTAHIMKEVPSYPEQGHNMKEVLSCCGQLMVSSVTGFTPAVDSYDRLITLTVSYPNCIC